MSELQRLDMMIKELEDTTSILDKKSIIYHYSDLKQILNYIYDPFKQYYITSSVLNKEVPNNNIYAANIYYLLDALRKREITGHAAISAVRNFINTNQPYEEIIKRIIDKDLKCRIGAKIINQVHKGLIPEFNVALANDYEKVAHKVDFNKEGWYSSRKLDGLRMLTVIDTDGNPRFFSRTGKEFYTMDVIGRAIKRAGLKNIVLDGEVCIVDNNGNECFTSIMKEYNKKEHTIENPRYYLFDMLDNNVFFGKKEGKPFRYRIEFLSKALSPEWATEPKAVLSLVKQHLVRSTTELENMMQYAGDQGWEGLILRKDIPYEGKRSNNMLKIKQFKEAEFVVKSIDLATMRYIEGRREKSREMMSNVNIEYKNNIVSVGSGFSIQDRIRFCSYPDEIIGKVITVKYFEESQDQNGNYSLRFPTVKAIHGDRRCV